LIARDQGSFDPPNGAEAHAGAFCGLMDAYFFCRQSPDNTLFIGGD
jgi:hypothetical protein